MLRLVRNSVVHFIGSNTTTNALFRRITQRQVSQLTGDVGNGHSNVKTVDHGDFVVRVMPALGDNFMFLIQQKDQKGIIAVDPVDHKAISRQLAGSGFYLDSILTTHHHGDHDAGNRPLLRLYPELAIYATDERVDGYTHQLSHGSKFTRAGLEIRTLHTPAHTRGHGCFIIPSSSGPSAVFVGDTLFHGGAGRFFEGTARDFVSSLDIITDHIDENDLLYSGHEYAHSNLAFAASLEPDNTVLAERHERVKELREQKEPSIPTSLSLERQLNPFVRLETSDAIATATGQTDRIAVCARLREMKNNF